jgi:hypothetical protein
MVGPENAARHWCHQFAAPPPEAFTESPWPRFGEEMGIDLRSLPLSYLVLDVRGAPPLPPGATRLIGRPRIEKGRMRLLGCNERGLEERVILQRHDPGALRRAKRGELASIASWSTVQQDASESSRS